MTHNTSSKRRVLRAVAWISCLAAAVFAFGQIQKARIFQEDHPLITDTDLYCSYFILEGPLPEMRIIGAERGEEKTLFSDGDIVTANKGLDAEIEVGQIFEALDVGPDVKGLGRLMYRRGRAVVVLVEDRTSLMRVEKACFPVSLGSSLVPFEERETVVGRDLGFDAVSDDAAGVSGRIVYLDDDLKIIGTGGWALIDVGISSGVMPGVQMTVFRPGGEGKSREAVGNVVVIDAGEHAATIKVLSCRDTIERGDIVQAKTLPLP